MEDRRIRRGGLLVEALSSRDEWRLCCVVDRGTHCLVSGVVEVSVWVNNGIVVVGAGSSGSFVRAESTTEQLRTTGVRSATE